MKKLFSLLQSLFTFQATDDVTLSSNTSSRTMRVVTLTRADNRPATISESRSIAAQGTAIINLTASTTIIVEADSPTKGVIKTVPLVTKEDRTSISD